MPYFLRLFSTHQGPLSLSLLASCIDHGITVELEAGGTENVEALLLRTPDGRNLGVLEMADVELLEAEVEDFIDELQTSKPANAARWVAGYLTRARTLICFHVLDAGFESTHETMPGEMLWRLKGELGDGILQADGEGFTNCEGYHIVWQFSDAVSGPWKMAVLDGQDTWIAYEMELENREHRRAFLDGSVPSNVTALTN